MDIITHAKMDLERRGMTPIFYAVRGDINTRAVALELYNGAYAWIPPAGTTYVVQYHGPGGYGSYVTMDDGSPAVTMADNIMTIKIAPEVLTKDGRVAVVVCMTGANDGQVLHTYPIIGLISPNAAQDTDVFVVTTNVSNITTDAAGTATAGSSYRATLTANAGYTLDGAQVSVTMGGVDITSAAYSNGVVYITEVTGNIVITAAAVKLQVTTWRVLSTLENISSSAGNQVTVDDGTRFVATLTANDGYTLSGASVTITMGGADITDDVYSGGVITIAAVTGNVSITAAAAPIPVTYHTVTMLLTNLTSDTDATQTVRDGTEFTSTLTANDGWTLDGAQVSVTMGGVDITSSVYTAGTIHIDSVSGDVVVTASAVQMTYTVLLRLIDMTADAAETQTVIAGDSYAAILTPNDGYTLDGAVVGVVMGGQDVSGTAYADGRVYIQAVTGDVTIDGIANPAWSVKISLKNMTSDQPADATVGDGQSFTANLAPDAGYTLDGAQVSVTMGGADITADAYADGVIHIDTVTDNVEIAATAAAQSWTVTQNLTDISSDQPTVAAVANGASYTSTLSPKYGYQIDGAQVSVTMAGEDITADSYANGVITIPAVIGDVVITAVAASMTKYTITNQLTNITNNNAQSTAFEGYPYDAILTVDGYYTLDSANVAVTMGGEDITNDVYSDGVISIPAVWGDIVITGAAQWSTFEIIQNLYNVDSSNTETDVMGGNAYTTTLVAHDGYVLDYVHITMGGTDITGDSYIDGLVDIPEVMGDVIISAKAVEASGDDQYTVTVWTSNVVCSVLDGTTVAAGDSLTATLTAMAGYNINAADVTVTMGGIDITADSYNILARQIHIAQVTGNVRIVASIGASIS